MFSIYGFPQRYLADVRKPGEAKKAVADADFVPKPKVVKTEIEDFIFSCLRRSNFFSMAFVRLPSK